MGEDVAGFGVEIRVEVHGGVTQEWPNFAKIMAYADHPNVYVCWNSNPADVAENGSIRENFRLVAPRIREVHLRDLYDEAYPWRELFSLLSQSGYDGYTLAEIGESTDPMRVLKYFRSLIGISAQKHGLSVVYVGRRSIEITAGSHAQRCA